MKEHIIMFIKWYHHRYHHLVLLLLLPLVSPSSASFLFPSLFLIQTFFTIFSRSFSCPFFINFPLCRSYRLHWFPLKLKSPSCLYLSPSIDSRLFDSLQSKPICTVYLSSIKIPMVLQSAVSCYFLGNFVSETEPYSKQYAIIFNISVRLEVFSTLF